MLQEKNQNYKKIKFKLKMAIPRTTHQQKKFSMKNGKMIAYEGDSLKQARQEFMLRLAPHKPKQKIENATVLVTKWNYGTNNKYKIGKVKSTSPDTDNIVKLPKDCMTKLGYWKDDGLVCHDVIIKCWNTKENEGIEVLIIGVPKGHENTEKVTEILLKELADL